MTTDTATHRAEIDAPRSGGRPGATSSAEGGLRAAPTLMGALAVIGGSTALLPLVAGAAWLLPVIEVVAVVWLVGIGGRLVRIPPSGVELLQLAALSIALTSLFTTSGVAGVLPGPAAIREGAGMFGAAWEQIMTSVPPASATAELSLVIALAAGGLALVVDLLIAGAKAPALVALPLLGLYAVPAAIYSELLPWYAFVLPAACYAALLALSGHRGIRTSAPAAVSLGISGAIIAAISIGGAWAIADAATGIGTDGHIPHTSHSGGPVGLSPWALLRGQLRNDDPTNVLKVSGVSQPAYLRTFALEQWTEDKGFGFGPISADVTNLDGPVPGAKVGSRRTATATVTPLSYRDKYLPIYPGATQISGVGQGWNYDARLQTIFRKDPTIPAPYSVTAPTEAASATELRQENVRSGGPLTQTGDLPQQVVSLAKSLTAHAKNPFDAANAILSYFTNPANGFTYSLSTPLGSSGNALVDFLTEKQGYCEQYAAAMAIMVRSVGIPARVGVGFTQGTRQPDGSYEITSNDAHAWVEVNFEKSGWVMFDPTPKVDGQGGLQGFVADAGAAGDAGGEGSGQTTSTGPSATSTAPSTTRSLQGALPNEGRKIPEADGSVATGSTATPPLGGHLPVVVIVAVSALVLVLGLLAPSALRRSRRRRRLAASAGKRPGAGTAAWEEIRDTLVDHGMTPRGEESARAVANRLARAAHLPSASREGLKTVITTAEREWYGAEPSAPTDLSPGVVAVINALDVAEPRSWSERIWPRSLRRR